MSAEVLGFGVLVGGVVCWLVVELVWWVGREVARERRMAAKAKDAKDGAASGPPIRERGRDA